MPDPVDLYGGTYSQFTERVLAAVRAETFGEDIGQNSWLTAEEFDRFTSWLLLSAESNVLEVASGSGGPALYMAQKYGCRVTGVDMNPYGVSTAGRTAMNANIQRGQRVTPGRDAVCAHEQAGHMALVGKAARCRGVRQRVAFADQAARRQQPALHLVGVGRQAGGAGKGAQHLVAAQAAGGGQIGQRYRRSRVIVDQGASMSSLMIIRNGSSLSNAKWKVSRRM